MTSEMVEFVDPGDAGRTWRFEQSFLESNWTCIWGRGCAGILDAPAAHLNHGCCSVGAEVLDDDEAMLIAALGASLDPALFEFHESATSGVFVEGESAEGESAEGESAEGNGSAKRNTRVVDGACIFLNRPGFAGGAGCALHLGAVASDEDPHEWKPSVCWQLPIRVEYEQHEDASETATLRRWSRSDWGSEGASMAWLCTDENEVSREIADAFVGAVPVVESLEPELTALLGRAVYVELAERMKR